MTTKQRTEYLTNLTEKQLFELLKEKRYNDLIDLNTQSDLTKIDWYSPLGNIWMEGKCRDIHYEGAFIQKDKYEALMKKENCWYINSTPKGIYYWDLKEMEEPMWMEKLMEESQQFKSRGKVWKTVAELRVQLANQLDHLLLPYN